MSGDAFSIEIVPEFLPEELAAPYAGALDELWRGPLARHVGLRQILYRVGGQMYADYPAGLLVVLDDLEREAQAFADGRSHVLELAGRPVAYARCGEGRAWFEPPPTRVDGARPEPAVEGVPLDDIRAAFKATITQIRRHVGHLLG